MSDAIKRIGVIGAGQMGAGIAQVSAMTGFETKLFDTSEDALRRGYKGIESQLNRLVEKEKISAEKANDSLARLSQVNGLKDFQDCDLIIEAIIENVEIKCDLFKELDTLIPENTIFASNTSSISITRLAASTTRPEKMIGMHFMNPVPVMKLVELIRGLQTSDETYNTICSVVEQMGKTSVLAVDMPGFIVNRILCPMINEAIYLLQEGVKAEDIDNAMKLGTNQPMGPLTLADFVGLDTLLYILRILHRELGEDKYRPCPLLVKYVEAGWYGRKSGRGFYSYS
ncbi:MAG: 3-hydroxybutyryl-CoA dehydrogenase [Candidatus Dadabacteria bacterium]|nr:MAG: 3-hydroxybutyryl-CoA dehydrogenase [Candidatus Dadabacteria bacterium]